MEHTILIIVLGVLPWSFVALGAYLLYAARSFMKNATRATGRVVAVYENTGAAEPGSGAGSRPGTSNRQATAYKPVFEYQDEAGNTQQAQTFMASTSFNFQVGSEHEILIDPNMPDLVRMPGNMIYGVGGFFLASGLVFGVVGIIALRAM